MGWWLASTYLLSFGPALLYSTVYWRRERGEGPGLLRCWLWGHLYVAYGLMWYAAGWWAVARLLRGQHGWVKTARSVETTEPAELTTPLSGAHMPAGASSGG